MHVVIVDFRVPGKTLEEVHDFLEPLVPAFADLPGLLAKIWIADPASSTYGAVYLWRDEDVAAGFLASELWKAVETTDGLEGVRARSFACVEDFTKATQPELVIV